jgi:alkylation response protein AidB-like acyl-CoA dehydrogenase
VQAPAEIRDAELRAVRDDARLLGVWGGEPLPGEGPPAEVRRHRAGEVLRGVKTFCSGAGGLQRALVLARDSTASPPGGPPVLVLIDLTDSGRVEIDPSWYRSHGLVASASHRVLFHDAPVLAHLGEPGAIAVQPWFGRDGLRTAASWAGMADTAARAALAALRERPRTGELEGLAAGRILTARHTIDVWLAAAATAMDAAGPALPALALHGRVAIAAACRALLDEAARACGSHPFATAGALDRARRDLEVFLLQHRLEPMLARAGAAALHAGAEPWP